MTRKQTGVALVEFALVLPFLLVLIAVTTEVGRAVYRYNTTAKTVRDAVRYLSVQPPGTHITETRNLIVYGNTAGTGLPLDPDLTTDKVPDPTWQIVGSNPVMNTVTVRVSGYQFRPMTANMFGTTFSVLTYNDITATMRSAL